MFNAIRLPLHLFPREAALVDSQDSVTSSTAHLQVTAKLYSIVKLFFFFLSQACLFQQKLPLTVFCVMLNLSDMQSLKAS